MWPGAVLLNDYLSKNAEMLQGLSIIELGSGVGMFISIILSNHIVFLSSLYWIVELL